MPLVDGSREASRYLDSLPGDADMEADTMQALMAGVLRDWRRKEKEAATYAELVTAQLKESMVGGYSLRGDGFRISWKPTKERTRIGWEQVAQAYRRVIEKAGVPDLELDAIQSLYTTTEQGSRPFRVTWTDEEEAA